MKKVLMQQRFLLGYSDVYNDNGSAPVHILTNIPQLAAIELISHLLHLYNVRQKDDLRFQSNRLFEWMMKTTEESKRQLLLFIQRQQNLINGQSLVLIDRKPCLDLIQYILVYANPHENSSLDANHYTILLKCLLYFNEVENKIQKKLFNWEEGQGLSKFIDYILITQFRNIGFERFKEFQIEFLKAFYFFDFCQYNEKYSAHLTVFLNSLGLSSYKSYLWKIFDLLHKLLEAEQPTPIMYVNDKNVSDFCLQLSITCSIEKNNLDYKMMRSYPLFQVQQNKYVFMNYHFFIDKLYQGFLFDFSQRTALNFGELRTDMGNLFSEKILFNTAMKKCFNSYGDVRLSGEELKTKLKKGEPDYYIREGTKLFVFEFKDAIINASDKYSANPNTIKSGIIEKFEISKEGKKKGITQLMNTIVNIKNGVFNEVDITNWENVVIYPIIVYGLAPFKSDNFYEVNNLI